MPTVVLVRHALSAANVAGVLAGRSQGVSLDDVGVAQAEALGERLRSVEPAAFVSSPLDRCLETARAIATEMATVLADDRLTECDYGDWTGRPVAELSRQKLWRTVQEHPSSVIFPGGESLRAVQARAVDAVREYDARLSAEAGPAAVWVAVSHADVIKAVVADALGMHLDHFQRLVVDPCSVSVVSFSDRRPYVLKLNDTGGDLAFLRPSRRRRRPGTGDGASR